MKVYIVVKDSFSKPTDRDTYCNFVWSAIYEVFDSRDKAVKYIESNWPEAKREFKFGGEYWRREPTEEQDWLELLYNLEKELA